MIPLSLAVFLTGLVLGVLAMLFGTVRRARPVAAPHELLSARAREPSPLFNLATVAAFTVGFGFTAYLVARYSEWPLAAQLLVATAAGTLALTVQSALIARWAIPSARAEQVDERYVLQGTVARVSQSVPQDGTGEIRYLLDERGHVFPARHVDHQAISINADVVIDRVELGIAYVEPWASVEKRL